MKHIQKQQWKLSFKQIAKHSVWKCLTSYLVVKNGKKTMLPCQKVNKKCYFFSKMQFYSIYSSKYHFNEGNPPLCWDTQMLKSSLSQLLQQCKLQNNLELACFSVQYITFYTGFGKNAPCKKESSTESELKLLEIMN